MTLARWDHFQSGFYIKLNSLTQLLSKDSFWSSLFLEVKESLSHLFQNHISESHILFLPTLVCQARLHHYIHCVSTQSIHSKIYFENKQIKTKPEKQLGCLLSLKRRKAFLTHHYSQVYPIPICLVELKNQSCRLYHPAFRRRKASVQN